MKNLNIKMNYSSVTGFTESMQPITTVLLNGIPYYDMTTFERIYKKDYSTIDRYLKKNSLGLVKVDGKKYVNEIVLRESKKGLEFWKSLSEETIVTEGTSISFVQPDSETNFSVTGITLDTGVQYFSMDQFVQHFHLPYNQVYSIIKKLPTKKRYLYCLPLGGKLYVSPHILIYLKKHLGHLHNLDYAWLCERYTWDIVGTISLEQYMSVDACRNLMERIFRKLCKRHPNTVHYMFFVTERNPGRDGHHTHFVYGNHKHPDGDEIEKVVQDVLTPYGGNIQRRLLMEEIKPKEYFIEYMVKQIHILPNHYDWLHENIL